MKISADHAAQFLSVSLQAQTGDDAVAPLCLQRRRHPPRPALPVRPACPGFSGNVFAAVEVGNEGAQTQRPFAVHPVGIGAERQFATATEQPADGALGSAGDGGRGVIELGKQIGGVVVVRHDLDAQRGLTGRRQRFLDRDGARIRSLKPSRTRPAAARMMASNSPASSLARRVLTLPRTGLKSSVGRRLSTAARRKLEVPTTARRHRGQ